MAESMTFLQIKLKFHEVDFSNGIIDENRASFTSSHLILAHMVTISPKRKLKFAYHDNLYRVFRLKIVKIKSEDCLE